MLDLSTLNNEQIEAVQQITGAVSVVAGAGSGKTRTLTSRIAYMISEGIKPSSIVAVTFTNKAAREMKERVINLIGPHAEAITVSTFHSFCAGFLRNEIKHLNRGYTSRFLIIDEEDSKQIIRDTVKDLNFDPNEYNSNRLKAIFSKVKNKDYDYLTPNEEQIFNAYNRYLEVNNSLDFDDLILLVIEVLQKNEEVKIYYNELYQYILVDEFQDTNRPQYELIKLLAGHYKNIFIVGDPDQSIYSFRGAKYENHKRFINDFKPKIVVLNQNYRSKTSILEAANKLIKNNVERETNKELTSDLGKGTPIVFNTSATDRDEANFILNAIFYYKQKGYSYDDIAVLYRTNAISRIFEDVFIRENIPYIIYGGLSFYQRKEIKDILAYMRLMINPDDNISFKRVINTPRRKIGQVTIQKLESYAKLFNTSLYEAMDHVDVSIATKRSFEDFKRIIGSLRENLEKLTHLPDIVDLVNERSGYLFMLESEGHESEDRKENIQELKAMFYNIGMTDVESNVETLQSILDDLSLKTSIDIDHHQEAVKLATVHQVKGLEFKVVIVVALEEGIFPNQSAMFSHFEMEEERRVCYVALTRAQEHLILSHSLSRYRFGQVVYLKPSRYLDEVRQLQDVVEDITPYDFNEETFELGEKVKHDVYGIGVIVEVKEDIIKVAFDINHGIKLLQKGHPSFKKVKH